MRFFFFIKIFQLNSEKEMLGLEYHQHFVIPNELVDVPIKHQFADIIKRVTTRHSVPYDERALHHLLSCLGD